MQGMFTAWATTSFSNWPCSVGSINVSFYVPVSDADGRLLSPWPDTAVLCPVPCVLLSCVLLSCVLCPAVLCRTFHDVPHPDSGWLSCWSIPSLCCQTLCLHVKISKKWRDTELSRFQCSFKQQAVHICSCLCRNMEHRRGRTETRFVLTITCKF
jgi:hypothetical protein